MGLATSKPPTGSITPAALPLFGGPPPIPVKSTIEAKTSLEEEVEVEGTMEEMTQQQQQMMQQQQMVMRQSSSMTNYMILQSVKSASK